MKKLSKKKLIAIIVIIIALLVLSAVAAVFIIFHDKPEEAASLDEMLALGEKYLIADDYESALVAFEKAIEIDAKCSDAYIGAAKAYIGMGEPQKAIGILKLGLERTNDGKIKDMLLDLDGEEISVTIQQIDNSKFPVVDLYIAAKDEKGRAISDLSLDNFTVTENVQGEDFEGKVLKVERVKEAEKIGVDLVLDQSGSMSDYEKIEQAKYAAKKFLDGVDFVKGDQVAVVTFDDYVYQKQGFTADKANLISTIDSIQPNGQTAFYDALYAALIDANKLDGAKSVIAYTDGIENASRRTYDQVVMLANQTGIPIFTIGIGEDCDNQFLQDLATTTSGEYYSISEREFGKSLRKIYDTIYREQTEWIKISYKSDCSDDQTAEREIALTAKRGYKGEALREYTPHTEIESYFNDIIANVDFIIPTSNSTSVNESELTKLSLAQLEIAKNEIYARHGSMFSDAMLNLWFNSKPWYSKISPKYTPSEFSALEPYPLSEIEQINMDLIDDYEDELIYSGNIFPNSSTALLSEFDVILSDYLLERGLGEIYDGQNLDYGDKSGLNSTQKKNVELIENALAQ